MFESAASDVLIVTRRIDRFRSIMQASVSTCVVNQSQTSSPTELSHPSFPNAQVSPKRVRESPKDLLKGETDFLSREYIIYRCREEGIVLPCSSKNDFVPSKRTEEVLELLKKLCYKYEKQYEGKLKLCCEKLKSNKSNASRNFFDVAKELFSRNNLKWEHIIVLMAFSGQLAINYVLRDMMDYIECLIGWLSIFLFDRLGDWILTHDGWVSPSSHMCVSINLRNVNVFKMILLLLFHIWLSFHYTTLTYNNIKVTIYFIVCRLASLNTKCRMITSGQHLYRSV